MRTEYEERDVYSGSDTRLLIIKSIRFTDMASVMVFLYVGII